MPRKFLPTSSPGMISIEDNDNVDTSKHPEDRSSYFDAIFHATANSGMEDNTQSTVLLDVLPLEQGAQSIPHISYLFKCFIVGFTIFVVMIVVLVAVRIYRAKILNVTSSSRIRNSLIFEEKDDREKSSSKEQPNYPPIGRRKSNLPERQRPASRS